MRTKGTLSILLGMAMLLAAAGLTAYNLQDDVQAGAAASQDLTQLVRYSEEQREDTRPGRGAETLPAPADYELVPEMEMPVVEIDGREYVGTLFLPSIGRTLPVLYSWDYDLLKIAPCRYEGSVYNHSMIIMAHNYDSHFGRLKKLQIGDTVTFRDVENNEFPYEVVSLEVLNPGDVQPMEEGEWDLTLFTCTIGGKTRITVRCAQIPEKKPGM